jgi:hypothetical protein
MNIGVIRDGISCYTVETKNIRYFLREYRSILEWQDWLRLRVPKLSAKTERLPPSAIRLGQGWGDIACRYTDLLTYLVMCGDIERNRDDGEVVYKWVGE